MLFDDEEIDQLRSLLTTYSLSLLHLLESWEFTVPCPDHYSRLLHSLATLSPVCALFPPTASNLELMDKLSTGYSVRSDPVAWSTLQNTSPILTTLIINLNTTYIPEILRPVLKDIAMKSKRPFEVVKPEDDITYESINDGCFFYPHLQGKRLRRKYKADLNKKVVTCTKVHRGHPSLLPGIFTVFCPHGIQYIILCI